MVWASMHGYSEAGLVGFYLVRTSGRRHWLKVPLDTVRIESWRLTLCQYFDGSLAPRVDDASQGRPSDHKRD